MNRKFVKVLVDVHCEWNSPPPYYRVYVNDELFAERTWIWSFEYLEECISIEAEPGTYTISYELVQPHTSTIRVRNFRISDPESTITDSGILTIN
jgi:hypothetical protein